MLHGAGSRRILFFRTPCGLEVNQIWTSSLTRPLFKLQKRPPGLEGLEGLYAERRRVKHSEMARDEGVASGMRRVATRGRAWWCGKRE